MNTETAICVRCAQLQDEFLTELQRGRRPEIADFVARHLEHSEPLRVALEGEIAVLAAVKPRRYRPPTKLTATVNLKNKGGLLGRGGQAEVVSFEDSDWKSEVAVKFPRGDKYANGSDAERQETDRRFWKEAQIVSRLNHPGVAPIFAHGICHEPILAPLPPGGDLEETLDGLDSPTAFAPDRSEPTAGDRLATGESVGRGSWPFYVMRRIQGKTLEKRVKEFHEAGLRLARDENEFRKLLDSFRSVCQTIQHAHEKNIVHRDLKPANIVIGNNGVTTVLDWGIARDIAESDEPAWGAASGHLDHAGKTAEGSAIGTPDFMAPEQAAGRQPDIGPRTDVYGLGATLFFLLTGKAPHAGRTLQQIETEPAPRAASDSSPVPPELVSICAKAMAFTPDNRYASAAKLETAIDLWLAGEMIAAHDYTPNEELLLWARKNLLAVIVTTVILLAAAITATGIGVAQSRARDAEKKQRIEVERERSEADKARLHVETLLTQQELEKAVKHLQSGARLTADDISYESKETSSADGAFLKYAVAQRPRPNSRITTGQWGVVAAVFDATSRRFAVAHADGDLSIWDADRRELIRQLAKPSWNDELKVTLHYAMRRRLENEGQGQVEWFTGLAWLDQGESLAAATMSGRGLLFNSADGQSRELLAGEKPLLAVAASTDGQTLLFGDSAGRVFRRSLGDDPPIERLVAAAETTPISCLGWCSPLSAWIVGDNAGRIQLLDGATLETITAMELIGPIWSLDSAKHKQETRIAVGGGEGRVQVFRFDLETKRLLLGQVLPLPQPNARNQAAHVLRFGPGGDRLWAIDNFDNRGSLVEWSVSEQQFHWTNETVYLDDRRRGIEVQLAAKTPPGELPLPFRRNGSTIQITGSDSLMAAGDDGLISLWTLPPRGRGTLWGTTVYERLVGPAARLAFSKSNHEQLWAIDRTGQLVLADAATGKALARRDKAHTGMPVAIAAPSADGAKVPTWQPPAYATGVDIAALPDGVMVTAGSDSEMRFWRLEKGKLVAARKPIRHERPLISVAASVDGKWLSAVDENAGFGVWKTATGERQYFEQLPGPAGRPCTGRTAFNADGTWLAAFGAEQTGCVFECDEQDGRLHVRRKPDLASVAGAYGGTALAWNPAVSDQLAFADDHPRLPFRSFGKDAGKQVATGMVPATVVDILATPDGRRLLWVNQAGGIASHDTRHGLRMVDLESSLKGVTGMAIDRLGQRLAIANDAGTIEIWNTAALNKSSLPEPKDGTAAWTATDLLPPSSAIPNYAARTLQFDGQGHAHFLLTESYPGDYNGDGALFLISENGLQVTRERLTIGKPEFENRMFAEACALHLHEGQPLVVFRCRTAKGSPYDGEFYLARRTGPGKWTRELIHKEGNLGFYPVLKVAADGRLTDVFHFTFSGMYLVHSFRQGDGWEAEFVGEQGDGYQVAGWNHGETTHLLTDTNRFNNDHANPVYLQWKPGGGQMLREQLPAALNYSKQITGLPNGLPIVMQHRGEAGLTDRLLIRSEAGWIEHQSLPADLKNEIGNWAVGPDGAAYVIEWQKLEERLVLWRGQGETWSGQVLATARQLPGLPTKFVVHVDPQGRPVVIVGRIGEPFGWLKAFRPRK